MDFYKVVDDVLALLRGRGRVTYRALKVQSLLLDSGVLADQQLNERRKQRFTSLADVVNELEETQVEREFLLGNAPMRTQPTPK